MKKMTFLSLLIAVVALVASPVSAYAKGWEQLKVEKSESRHVASDAELQIRAAGGVIYLTTYKPVNIKIFTILGSQIANDNLSAGSYQFAVPAHGVYIIKAGDLTCKVAV